MGRCSLRRAYFDHQACCCTFGPLVHSIGRTRAWGIDPFACLPSAVFNFMLADKFQVEPNKVASTVIVGHLLSLAFLPLGIWLAFI